MCSQEARVRYIGGHIYIGGLLAVRTQSETVCLTRPCVPAPHSAVEALERASSTPC